MLMQFDLSARTIERAIQLACGDGLIEDAGDHSKDGFFSNLYLYIQSIFSDEAQQKIDSKKDFLKNQTGYITKQLLNTKKIGNDGYLCNLTLNGQMFSILQGHNSDDIIIQDTNGNTKTIYNLKFPTLQKKMLQVFLQKERNSAVLDGEPIKLASGDNLADQFDLIGIPLKGVSFKGVELTRENLIAITRHNLDGEVDLSGATLAPGAVVNDLAFTSIKMDKALLESLANGGANLRGVDVSGKDLTGIKNLIGVDFTDANFRNTICRSVELNGCNFTGAHVEGADFESANLTLADLSHIHTSTETNFKKSSVLEAINASRLFANQEKPYDALPAGLILNRSQVMEMAGQGHSHCNFDGINLSPGSNYADFSENRDNLTSLTFKNGELARTNFNGANLTDASFENADLSNVTMDANTNLTGTNFTNTNFTGADLKTVPITPNTKINGCTLTNAKLSLEWIRAAADLGLGLQGVDFGDLDLTDIDLSKCDCTGANFRFATLTGTILNKSGLLAAIKTKSTDDENGVRQSLDLSGIIIKGTVENPLDFTSSAAGESLDLNKANLGGAQFIHCILTSVDLRNSDASDATFTNCNLDSSKLDNANFSRINLVSTSLINATGGNTVQIDPESYTRYVEQFKIRLSHLVNQRSTFFLITDSTLKHGNTSLDSGPQSIYDENGLRANTVLTDENIEVETALIEANLKKGGFSREEKILFHWARSLMCAALEDRYGAGDEKSTKAVLAEIYESNKEFPGQALNQNLMTACFLIAWQKVVDKYPDAQIDQQAVRDFFMSVNYNWNVK